MIPKKEKIPLDIVVRANPKGHMSTQQMMDWITSIWNRWQGGVCKENSLLVLYAFKGHVADEVKATLQKGNCETVIIPGGMTSQLQTLDIFINKPFKARVRDQYEDWLSLGNLLLTPTGKIKRVQYQW